MKRWPFTGAAAVSLLLALATAFVWVATRAHYHNLRFSRATSIWQSIDVSANRGLMQIGRMTMSKPPPGERVGGWHVEHDDSPGMADTFVGERRLGFGYFDRAWQATPTVDRRTTALVVPLWFVMLVFSVAPALWMRAALRRRRRASRLRRGLCIACGYDLRASTGACPECGHTRAGAVEDLLPQTQTRA